MRDDEMLRKYEVAEKKAEMKKQHSTSSAGMQMPNSKTGMSERPAGLRSVTLEGSGRSKFPAMKKFSAGC